MKSVPDNSTTSTDVRLIDNYGRPITYLRLAITDRCNLRCRYCRPENGIPFIPHDEILRFEELERLVRLFSELGVHKIRITGGEPFERRDCLPFLQRLREIEGVKSLHITTNGVKTGLFLDEIKSIGIDGINLSLDTLDPKRFWQITRRDCLNSVLETLQGVLARGIPLKVNSVVLEESTDEDIVRLASLAQKYPLTLRFIERMPFSGTSRSEAIKNGDLDSRLKKIFPALTELGQGWPTTARLYSIPGFKGNLGLIQGYSRLFCKTCNKVRITPAGILKTCLYDNGTLDLRALVRSTADDQEIRAAIVTCIHNRFINGLEAERLCTRSEEPSMANIGG